MKMQKGLGRGLDAIFSSAKIDSKIAPMSEFTQVELNKIAPNPTQPRHEFDAEPLATLAESIKELGLIQPITLRVGERGNYTIISGERRWRAAQIAGLAKIPAYIREVDDEMMHTLALVENLQRENLNPIEIALGFQRLIDECKLTQEMLAQKMAMKRSSVSNFLRLLRMDDEVQFALKEGVITMGHAKAIASIKSREERIALLKICIERAISVREAESRAQAIEERIPAPKAQKNSEIPTGFEGLSQHLGGIFARGVEIKTNNRGGGRIVINFDNDTEIEQLIAQLNIKR